MTRRNEPLDTWVYAYAAAHHPHLRLDRLREPDWASREARLWREPGPPPPVPGDKPAPKPGFRPSPKGSDYRPGEW
jgi:phage terminase large subunit GpA-like protein